ncbi:hypothetical protein GH714_007548 [Hevea brasiliensis]|uniref:Uncharacterized protein n=1 Tax=Hevea brasiliensis TaxID=3981 RepID=A0A6A6KA56_HEVBR|nr:hypothetical protein GH714_007548 [Hevea brasiliensis]
MTTSNHFETFNVRFTGKNYSASEFQFQFVTGKELWGHVDGSDPAPTDSNELLQWNVKDAWLMTWILGSVDPLIVPNLRPYKTAKGHVGLLKKAAKPVVLTPEMVQQMIVSAFSALGLQGNDIASSQFWLVNSAASNHMTNSSSMLKNVRSGVGDSNREGA